MRIRYAAASRESLEQVGALRLLPPESDRWIPAAAFGELTLKPEAPVITRRNGERVNEIRGYLQPDFLPIWVTRTVLAQLDTGALDLPPGYRVEVAGDSPGQPQEVVQLMTHVPLVATLMVS